MKASRIFAPLLVAGASLAMLTGCIAPPSLDVDTTDPEETTVESSSPAESTEPETSESTPPEETDDGAITEEALIDTRWIGADDTVDFDFMFMADGQYKIYDWQGKEFDVTSSDYWTFEEGIVEIYVSGVADVGGVTFTGPAALGEMNMSVAADDGSVDDTITFTQK
ncbi:hypothetical protein [Humidisolicoccus flavus]|uniref:hypothetical protein n=1 Tax=Humidisolicoccus flavus TaxID=3111414 RepID=UPI0032542B31